MANLWDQTLALGVPEIDRQHQELFSRFGKLLDACKQGQGRSEVGKLLTFLEEYVDYHFITEEAWMREQGYAGLDEHRREHQTFRQKLSGLQQILADQGAGMDLLTKTNKTVLDWIIQHIRNTDRATGQALRR